MKKLFALVLALLLAVPANLENKGLAENSGGGTEPLTTTDYWGYMVEITPEPAKAAEQPEREEDMSYLDQEGLKYYNGKIQSRLSESITNIKTATNIVESNVLSRGTEKLDTYVNKNGVESSNDSFFSYKNIDVSDYKGIRLYANGEGVSIVLRAVSFYKEDGSYLTGLENVASGGYFAPPVFAKYMTVSVPYADRQKKVKPNNLFVSSNKHGELNFDFVATDKIKEDVKIISETRNLLYGKQIVPRYYVNGTSFGDSDDFFCIENIKVIYGVNYRIHCDRSALVGNDARFITEFDSSGNVVNVVQYVSKSYTPTSSNVDHITITMYYLDAYPVANIGLYYMSPFKTTENTVLLTNTDRISKSNIADMDVYYEETRKATICFSFDDGVEQDSAIASVFDSYGAKCGFALISSSALSSNRIEWYRSLYQRGYSILCHSDNGDNMGNETNYTTAQLLTKMRDTRVAFEKFGIKISGWVTPSSFMKSDYVSVLSKYYNYGFTRYFGAYDDTSRIPYDDLSNSGYYLKRVHIGTTSINNLKLAVDNAIENNGLLSFYGHSYELDDGTLDIGKLKEIIRYVKEKEHNLDCHLYAPDDAMTYYFRPRHND